MEYKICTKCEKEKSLNNFSKGKGFKNGIRSWCKECETIYKKAYRKINPAKINEYNKQWRINNSEKYKAIRKRTYEKNRDKRIENCRNYNSNNPEKIYTKNKKWKNSNIEKVLEQRKRYREKNRLNNRISELMRSSLKGNKSNKHWEELVGYKLADLIYHLRNKFKDGMTWEKLLKGEIHIDHIIPISFFQFSSYLDWEFKYCWSLDNLQPLFAKENISKGNRVHYGGI